MDEILGRYGLQLMSGDRHLDPGAPESSWVSGMVTKLFPGYNGRDCNGSGYYFDCGSFKMELNTSCDSDMAEILPSGELGDGGQSGSILADLDGVIIAIDSDGVETRADLERLADRIDFSTF